MRPTDQYTRTSAGIESGRPSRRRSATRTDPPRSGSQKKNWPAGNFAELMGKLANWGWDFRVLRGPADAQSVKNLLRAWDGIGVRVIEPESVSDLCGVLAAFDLVVSNDSGVAHLSAALGRPTVAVFGPTNVFRWVPRGAAAVAVPPKFGRQLAIGGGSCARLQGRHRIKGRAGGWVLGHAHPRSLPQ